MKQHRDILRLNFILMNAPMSNDWFQVLGHQNLTVLWRPVLVVEEAGENHRPWISNW